MHACEQNWERGVRPTTQPRVLTMSQRKKLPLQQRVASGGGHKALGFGSKSRRRGFAEPKRNLTDIVRGSLPICGWFLSLPHLSTIEFSIWLNRVNTCCNPMVTVGAVYPKKALVRQTPTITRNQRSARSSIHPPRGENPFVPCRERCPETSLLRVRWCRSDWRTLGHDNPQGRTLGPHAIRQQPRHPPVFTLL